MSFNANRLQPLSSSAQTHPLSKLGNQRIRHLTYVSNLADAVLGTTAPQSSEPPSGIEYMCLTLETSCVPNSLQTAEACNSWTFRKGEYASALARVTFEARCRELIASDRESPERTSSELGRCHEALLDFLAWIERVCIRLAAFEPGDPTGKFFKPPCVGRLWSTSEGRVAW